jgi:dTDP-4-amino-4,6-dideoxygalactose transaminase
MRISMTDLKPQYESIKNEVDTVIRSVIESGQFILSPEVKAFEDEAALFCGTKYAVGVASGTEALQLAILASGIKPGDEIITTPFTFFATVESIVKCGAKPVFVDIDPITYNLDADQIASKITSHTKAILPVHLFGQPAMMNKILDIASKNKLIVIEDCAQAMGAEYKGKKVGSLGDVGCLSFFPAKNLGAFGDGGMVITSNSEIADKTRLLRAHGSKTTYIHSMHGFNSRLDALQAAILRVKLKHLAKWNQMRLANTKLYTKLISKIDDIKTPYQDRDSVSSCNYYTIRLNHKHIDRQKLKNNLESQGIQTNIYYPLSLHLQEVYQYMGYKKGNFPESELAQDEVLSLPMYPELSKDQIEEVCNQILKFVGS